MIRKLKPEVGDTILIHGGAGGVGGYAVQLAKLRGMYVYTSCSEYNFEYVRSLGADEAIDYNKVDVHEEIMRRTNGRGVDCVVNTLNTWTATRDLGILAFGGQLVAIEGLPRFEEFTFFEKAISIHEVALGAAHINGDLEISEVSCTNGRCLHLDAAAGRDTAAADPDGKVGGDSFISEKNED